MSENEEWNGNESSVVLSTARRCPRLILHRAPPNNRVFAMVSSAELFMAGVLCESSHPGEIPQRCDSFSIAAKCPPRIPGVRT